VVGSTAQARNPTRTETAKSSGVLSHPQQASARDGWSGHDREACTPQACGRVSTAQTRRAGGRLRNCEEKVQLKRLSRMPEERRAGGLAQELRAPGLADCAEPFQETIDLGVLSDPRKKASAFDADRGGRRP